MKFFFFEISYELNCELHTESQQLIPKMFLWDKKELWLKLIIINFFFLFYSSFVL